eukprot:CAMPEP_0185688798 /NCGR_PEP_ID=MMETSP1164-20130828/60_1 /TAXON_ID=1104430 /ORGANISM="Chrysoreinhardia sp, Strain CCMP2950" /LENGTH=287 /DNA_ID=CAMNT_0028355261 /DNA_START=150 /DNA_END=1009 /DNA_ORIENTATION=-
MSHTRHAARHPQRTKVGGQWAHEQQQEQQRQALAQKDQHHGRECATLLDPLTAAAAAVHSGEVFVTPTMDSASGGPVLLSREEELDAGRGGGGGDEDERRPDVPGEFGVGVALAGVARRVALRPLDARVAPQQAGGRDEDGMPDAADQRQRDELRVRLEGLLVAALDAVEVLGLLGEALGVELGVREPRLGVGVAVLERLLPARAARLADHEAEADHDEARRDAVDEDHAGVELRDGDADLREPDEPRHQKPLGGAARAADRQHPRNPGRGHWWSSSGSSWWRWEAS